MRPEWIIAFCLFTCGWGDEELRYAPEPDSRSLQESRTAPFTSEYDPWTSLSERYPNSQIKAGFFQNPYDSRHSQSNSQALPPYPPPAVPYNAAREYGLPGLGYVITDPYSTKHAPPANPEQENTGFSISSEPAEEVPPEEEESPETAIVTTTTTPRPTKPPLPPPPPPPPPPLPPPFHSTNSINLSPPRQSHRLPKLPAKPHIYTQKGAKKKPKKKLDKNRIEPEESYVNNDFVQREYVFEEGAPEDEYDSVNRVVLVRDPKSQRQYYYEFNVPSFAAA